MFNQDDEDNNTRVALWVVVGVITAVLIGVVATVVTQHLGRGKAVPETALAASVPEAAAPVAEAASDAGAAVVAAVEALLDGPATGTVVSTLYFELGSAALPADAATLLAAAQQALAAASGKKLVLSGYHDASGDPAQNAELAKQRAFAVRDALLAVGVDSAAVGLRKPESTTGGADPKEARRVDIRLVD